MEYSVLAIGLIDNGAKPNRIDFKFCELAELKGGKGDAKVFLGLAVTGKGICLAAVQSCLPSS